MFVKKCGGVVLQNADGFDFDSFYVYLTNSLPRYARPMFLRIKRQGKKNMKTSTLKYQKFRYSQVSRRKTQLSICTLEGKWGIYFSLGYVKRCLPLIPNLNPWGGFLGFGGTSNFDSFFKMDPITRLYGDLSFLRTIGRIYIFRRITYLSLERCLILCH